MKFLAVLDTSAFIWDKDDFEVNQTKYYHLANELSDFLQILIQENPRVFLSSELLDELINGFPVFELNQKFGGFSELTNLVYSYLCNSGARFVGYDSAELAGVSTIPELIKHHFSTVTKQEIKAQVSQMHVSDEAFIFFTFTRLWGIHTNLKTCTENATKEHETLVYLTETTLTDFFTRFKPIFEPSPKHISQEYFDKERNEMVSAWPYDKATSQKLLDTAIRSSTDNKRLFNFDVSNNIFLVFAHTINNKFHGYCETNLQSTGIPNDIKKHFMK